ncbi:hypothetical protein RFI_19410, partial [Reticulomyxa filosa]
RVATSKFHPKQSLIFEKKTSIFTAWLAEKIHVAARLSLQKKKEYLRSSFKIEVCAVVKEVRKKELCKENKRVEGKRGKKKKKSMANKDFENKEKKFEKDKNQIFEDDYEISLKKILWEDIPTDIAGKDEVNRIRLLAGGANDMLAPEGDITAIFSNPDDAKATAEAFLKVLETRDEAKLKYILTLLSHILEHDPKRGRAFLQAKSDSVMQPFIRVWIREDLSAFTRGKAAVCGSYILRWASNSLKDAYASLNTFVMNQMKSFKSDALVLPLYALKGAIPNLNFQSAFTQNGGIERLYLVIHENSEHRQVVYLAVFSLWALSFQ